MITTKECAKYLRKYGYRTNERALDKILKVWKINKMGILNKFRHHPNWDEENLCIVLKNTEYPKQFSRENIRTFKNWTNEIKNEFQKTKAKEDTSEKFYVNRLDDIRAMVRYAMKNNKKVEVEGKDVTEIQEEATREYEEYIERTENLIKINENEEKSYFLTEEQKEKIDKVYEAINWISRNCTGSKITAEEATIINNYYNVNATENQKLSRVINKLCSEIGLNEFKQTIQVTTDDGQEVERENGYQHNFNVMAQAITDKMYKVHTIISINPIDYWGMSLGYKWGSCQAIDIYNIGRRNNVYSGRWSSGTESLMLDKTTVVLYTLLEDYEGNLYYTQDKLNRCLFSISNDGDVIIQHVVYPDSRDGGDLNKVKQYREKVQEIVATLWGNENKWVNKTGTYNCNNYQKIIGTHYPDTQRNETSNVSLLKGCNSYPRIEIGHKPICPVCGKEHTDSNNIMCYDCKYDNYYKDLAIANIYEENTEFDYAEDVSYADYTIYDTNDIQEELLTETCETCRNEITEENKIEIDGHIFCSIKCAERKGWHLIEEVNEYINESTSRIIETENDGWHLIENTYNDDYDNNAYYGQAEISTTDGHCYHNKENAENDGYILFEEVWIKKDEIEFDSYTETYFKKENAEVITVDGKYFLYETSAIIKGYRETENGWVLSA